MKKTDVKRRREKSVKAITEKAAELRNNNNLWQ